MASRVASTSSGASPPSAVCTAATMSLPGNAMSGRVVNVPGIASHVFSTTALRPARIFDRAQ